MFPELFRIPGIDWPIYGFGVMLVLGLLAAMELGRWMARRSGLDPEVFSNAALLALLSGVVGARLSHVLENLGTYTDPSRSVWANLRDAVNVASGGLTYYGGLLLAAVVVSVYLVKKRMPLWRCADIVAPCVLVGLAFGRVGCFLNGCCFGQTCDLPWAVTFPYGSIPMEQQFREGRLPVPGELVVVDAEGRARLLPPAEALRNPLTSDAAGRLRSLPVHPAQLYSAAMALLLAGVCFTHWTVQAGAGPWYPGRTFALMLMLEGAARFALETLRVEPAVVHLGPGGTGTGMSLSMLLGLGLSALGVVMWFVFPRWNLPVTLAGVAAGPAGAATAGPAATTGVASAATADGERGRG